MTHVTGFRPMTPKADDFRVSDFKHHYKLNNPSHKGFEDNFHILKKLCLNECNASYQTHIQAKSTPNLRFSPNFIPLI